MKMCQDAQANLEIAFTDVEIEKSLLTVSKDISAGISDLSTFKHQSAGMYSP